MNRRTGVLVASCALLAGCGSAATVTVRPAASASASPATTAGCEAHLKKLAAQMGNAGTDAGRFQAAVNAEARAGTLGPACAVPGLENAGLMRLAAQAAGGH